MTAKKSTTVLLIALFKLVKGVALLAVALGALRFLHRDISQSIHHWVNVFRVDPDNHFVNSLLSRALRVTPRQLKEISAGTFIYSGLLLTEGIGLLMRRRWAEYFTIISTALLVPLEIYEIVEHVTLVKIGVLILNVAIVVYLVKRVRHTR